MPDLTLVSSIKSITTKEPMNETIPSSEGTTIKELSSIDKRGMEIEALGKVVNNLSRVRLNLTDSEGQGFLYNAEASILNYLQYIERKHVGS